MEATARRVEEYEQLLEIGVQLASTLELPRVLALAIEKAEELCRAQSGSLWELDDDTGELFFRVVKGKGARRIKDLRVPVGEGIVGDVARSGRSEIVNDVAGDPRWRGDPASETRAILTVPLIARGRVVGVIQLLDPLDRPGFTDEDRRRMELFAGPLAHAVANARLYAALKTQFFDTVTALSEAIEKRDPYTGGHVRRVVAYSVLLGSEMGLSDGDLDDLRLGATLHDIGKIAVPDRILGKPEPLDQAEEATMRQHTVDGAELVGRIRQLRRILPGVRSHHERMDGSGYPDGLAGDALPPIARIIAVADCYDAMTTSRPYREALPAEVAAAEIVRHAGSQFCEKVVTAFQRLFDAGGFTLEAARARLDALFDGAAVRRSPDLG